MEDKYTEISFNFEVGVSCMLKEDSFVPDEVHSQEILKWYNHYIYELKELSVTVISISFHFIKDNIYKCIYKLKNAENYTEEMFIDLHTRISDVGSEEFNLVEFDDVNYCIISKLVDKDIFFLTEKELVESLSKINIKDLN